jgi:hypothetical protein
MRIDGGRLTFLEDGDENKAKASGWNFSSFLAN